MANKAGSSLETQGRSKWPTKTEAAQNRRDARKLEAANRLVFRHLVSTKRNFLKKSILTEPTGTSSSIDGTYSPRGANTTSAFRNLLEPARNLFCANAWPQQNTIFSKMQVSWNLLEAL